MEIFKIGNLYFNVLYTTIESECRVIVHWHVDGCQLKFLGALSIDEAISAAGLTASEDK